MDEKDHLRLKSSANDETEYGKEPKLELDRTLTASVQKISRKYEKSGPHSKDQE
jgi:hypothetical protein